MSEIGSGATQDPVVISSIEEAVEHLELADVTFLEVSASRPDPPPAVEEEMQQGRLELKTAVRTGEDGVDYRMRVELNGVHMNVVVDAAIHYRAATPIEIAPEVVGEFGTYVAGMALFPYVREAVFDLARRVGVNVNLPVLKRGEIVYAVAEEDSSAIGN